MTGTSAHVGAPVQTGLHWAGLLDPLQAAGNDVGFPAQGLGPGSPHGGRGGPEKLSLTARDANMAYTPEGRGMGQIQQPVGSSSSRGSGALGFPHSSHLHRDGGMWRGGWGLELPIASQLPKGCAGMPTAGLRPGDTHDGLWGGTWQLGGRGGGGGAAPHIWRPLSINLPCGSISIYSFQPSMVGHARKSPSAVLAAPLVTRRPPGRGAGGPRCAAITCTSHRVSPRSRPPGSPCSAQPSQLRLQRQGAVPHRRSPRRSQTWSWPGALGHPQPKTTALALPGQRETEQEQEAPGAPAEGLLHHLDVHAAVPAPSEHSGSGHPALSGSSITSARRPHGSPREPRGRTAAAALRAGDAAAGEGPRRDSGFAPDMGGGQRP